MSRRAADSADVRVANFNGLGRLPVPWQDRYAPSSLFQTMKAYQGLHIVSAVHRMQRDAYLYSMSTRTEAKVESFEALKASATSLAYAAKEMELDQGSPSAHDLAVHVHLVGQEGTDPAIINLQVKNVITVIVRDLKSRRFLEVAPNVVDYYENKQPFGAIVYEAYPSIRYDCTEAANCIALSRPTACVFHLMRALETVLVILANRLKVPLKNLHIETQNTVISQIVKAIKDARAATPRTAKTKKRIGDLEFFDDIASRLESAKDAWRNSVAHSRSKYSEPEAISIYRVVDGLLQRAATRLREPKNRSRK